MLKFRVALGMARQMEASTNNSLTIGNMHRTLFRDKQNDEYRPTLLLNKWKASMI